MAEKKYTKDLQKDNGKFGHYQTGTGGGEPIDKGKKWTNEKRDPDQPRSQDGKFTYNSVNGKPLKEISKSHGHSRGTTIPPTLTGGVNGIHYYSDSTHEHLAEGAQDALERYTGLTYENAYRKGDGLIGFDGKVAIAKRDFMESAMEFVANKDKDKEYGDAVSEGIEIRKQLKDGDISKEEADKKLEEVASKMLATGQYKEERTGAWERKEIETEEEKAALHKAEAEDLKGHELIERKREKEFPMVSKIKASFGKKWGGTSTSSGVAPETPRPKPTISAAEAEDITAGLSDDIVRKFLDSNGAKDVDIKTGRAMLAESILDESMTEISSPEDIKKFVEGSEAPAAESSEKAPASEESISAKEESKIEEAAEEPTEEKLVEVLKKIDREELAAAIKNDDDVRNTILPFAQKWAEGKEEFEGKSDAELVSAFVEEKLAEPKTEEPEKTEEEEKEDTMKDFGLRGE